MKPEEASDLFWIFMDFLSFPPADGVVLIDPEYLKERKGEKSAALTFPI